VDERLYLYNCLCDISSQYRYYSVLVGVVVLSFRKVFSHWFRWSSMIGATMRVTTEFFILQVCYIPNRQLSYLCVAIHCCTLHRYISKALFHLSWLIFTIHVHRKSEKGAESRHMAFALPSRNLEGCRQEKSLTVSTELTPISSPYFRYFNLQ
jgi:hypothetical protein